MKLYQVQTRFFLIFILISVFALLSIPAIVKSFSKTTDKYLIAELKRAQAEMYFYEADHGNYKHACLSGLFGFNQYFLLEETGHAISCTVSPDLSSMSMFASLEEEGKFFCVDSNGLQVKTEQKDLFLGHCPK